MTLLLEVAKYKIGMVVFEGWGTSKVLLAPELLCLHRSTSDLATIVIPRRITPEREISKGCAGMELYS